MSDAEELRGYVDVWWQAIDDFTTLLETIPQDAWAQPTALPGWDVHAVAAHIAHLEAVAAGHPHDEIDIGSPAHVTSDFQRFTEQGVVARRAHSPDAVINEIRESATARQNRLLSAMPEDASQPADGVFGAIGWTWRTTLKNRALDVFSHEQDIRRALDLPATFSTPQARHTILYLAEGFGYVVARRAGLPAGTTAALDIDGETLACVRVSEEGRGVSVSPAELEGGPTVRLAMDAETYFLIAGGRRPEAPRVTVDGDGELAASILANLGTMP